MQDAYVTTLSIQKESIRDGQECYKINSSGEQVMVRCDLRIRQKPIVAFGWPKCSATSQRFQGRK
jgi:hypothetical protein